MECRFNESLGYPEIVKEQIALNNDFECGNFESKPKGIPHSNAFVLSGTLIRVELPIPKDLSAGTSLGQH